MTGGDEPERVNGELVKPAYFKLLRIKPLIGRAFDEEENRTGVARPPSSATGSGRAASAATRRSSVPRSRCPIVDPIVGIMPRGFRGLTDAADLWTTTSSEGQALTARGSRGPPCSAG